MAGLERTAVGLLHVSRAVSVEELLTGVSSHLLPARYFVDALSWLPITRDEMRELRHGRPIEKRPRRIEVPSLPEGVAYDEIAAVDEVGNLVAILFEKKPGELWPVRNFSQSE
jgi:tRNA U55 pseudouridine synthase TruB